MSKKAVFQFFIPTTEIDYANLQLASMSASTLIFKDIGDGDRLILRGHDLAYKGGYALRGVIDSMQFVDGSGEKSFSLTHLDLNVKMFPAAIIEFLPTLVLDAGAYRNNLMLGSEGVDELNGAFGNDIIRGRGGDDIITGYTGRDILSGGTGADRFVFAEHSGRDRVLDFDADGTDGSQDHIEAGTVISMTDVDGNAVLDFGSGDTVTLVGVAIADIDASDFVV